MATTYTATTSDESLKNSLAVSSGIHLLLLFLLYFGLPHLMAPLPTPHDPIPFEIVEIADITNTRLKEPEPQTKPPEQPPPPPEKKPETVQQPQPTPEVKPPTPAPPQPKVEEQAEALTATPAKKPPPPKPVTKPANDAFAKMLKNLELSKQPEAPKSPETKADSKSQAQPVASQAPSLSTRLTISQEDALRRQIEQNWNIPIGARDIENMVVEIHIDVNPDRTVQQAKIIDQGRMGDSFYRAVAESALRAVYASSPLELPADRYEQWKGINMSFNAKDAL
jgi:outer membrane biosynthesis protein TonB